MELSKPEKQNKDTSRKYLLLFWSAVLCGTVGYLLLKLQTPKFQLLADILIGLGCVLFVVWAVIISRDKKYKELYKELYKERLKQRRQRKYSLHSYFISAAILCGVFGYAIFKSQLPEFQPFAYISFGLCLLCIVLAVMIKWYKKNIKQEDEPPQYIK
jgi:ABC-type Mn2+/Zn2+ transport system permease subunit